MHRNSTLSVTQAQNQTQEHGAQKKQRYPLPLKVYIIRIFLEGPSENWTHKPLVIRPVL